MLRLCILSAVFFLPGASFPRGCFQQRVVPSQRRLSRPRISQPRLQTAVVPEKTVIVGGGPAGLATAIALARRGWSNIHIYDRLQEPPHPDDNLAWSDTARFYLIGLGGRGQKALRSLGLWDDVQRYTTAVNGRKDWGPGAGPDEGIETIYRDRPYVTQVLARDRLAGILLQAVRDRHQNAIDVHYGVECEGVEWRSEANGKENVKLKLHNCANHGDGALDSCEIDGTPFEESTSFLIGADGATRAIAEALEANSDLQMRNQRVRVRRYFDDNVRVYKAVPMKLPKGWSGDINYSSRSKDGRVVFDALPADADGNYCGVLLLRETDPLAKADTSASELRELLEDYVPQFSELVTEEALQAVAKRPPSRLPKFRFVGPCIHRGDNTVLLGDAIHTVKPYFGLGANSALEDVSVFSNVLEAAGDDVGPALKSFTQLRAKEAKALVQISRALDRPGLLGFATFVLPLISDVLFNKLAPWLFAPNTIAMLQRDGMTFCGVVRRKRIDRVLQLSVLSLGTMAMRFVSILASKALPGLLRLGPLKTGKVKALAVILAAAAVVGRAVFASKDMAPADVLGKVNGEVVPKTDPSKAQK